MIADPLGRVIRYLRLSLTPACGMRCIYCRPAAVGDPAPNERMSVEEIERLVRHLAAAHGLRKVRLTGGEPTQRHELVEIVRRLAAIDGLAELAMTTNGLNLQRLAPALADAGLQRVNLSLDSLDAAAFRRLTGVDGLERVLRGLDAAREAGLTPIKLNTVVVRGQNESELPRLLSFAAAQGLEIRFIELMPMGPLAAQWAQRYVPEADMRQCLDSIVQSWHPLEQGHDAARRYRVSLPDHRSATVGFITAMSCNFCATCNRVRIAADGTLYPCLMDQPGPNLMPALRPHFDPEELDRRLRGGLSLKKSEHPAQGHAVMVQLGG